MIVSHLQSNILIIFFQALEKDVNFTGDLDGKQKEYGSNDLKKKTRIFLVPSTLAESLVDFVHIYAGHVGYVCYML